MTLEIKNISKRYKKKKVLSNISLTLTNGVYGLLGPNGAGKSTLIGIITGLIFPDSGHIYYSDSNHKLFGEALGFLPQYQNFYSNFTAEEMLKYIMCLKKYKPEDTQRYIRELLEIVNLQDCQRKKIKFFSGGMKQRLGIAQALIGNPDIIIFDEPTAGLDPKERIRFRNIISSLGKEKIIILATHIVTDIAYIAKEVILIKDGKLILAAPQNKITESVCDKVWTVKCEYDNVAQIMYKYHVSNIIADENSFYVRIVSDEKPYESATSEIPNLDDACLYYFGEI